MPDLTPNYNIKKPLGNENTTRQAYNENLDIIDAALAPTANQALEPNGNGPGKLLQWVGWFANRIKAITGKSNWWDAPDVTLAAANTHINNKNNPHAVTAAQAGAEPANTYIMKRNVAQTMTATLVAKNGTDYITKQCRNIIISTNDPSGGSNGDVWLKYE